MQWPLCSCLLYFPLGDLMLFLEQCFCDILGVFLGLVRIFNLIFRRRAPRGAPREITARLEVQWVQCARIIKKRETKNKSAPYQSIISISWHASANSEVVARFAEARPFLVVVVVAGVGIGV
jgi:hypothetical protein